MGGDLKGNTGAVRAVTCGLATRDSWSWQPWRLFCPLQLRSSWRCADMSAFRIDERTAFALLTSVRREDAAFAERKATVIGSPLLRGPRLAPLLDAFNDSSPPLANDRVLLCKSS